MIKIENKVKELYHENLKFYYSMENDIDDGIGNEMLTIKWTAQIATI
jgi:hypothetical protein